MPEAALLNSFKEAAVAIAGSTNRDTDVHCGNNDTLVVQAELTGAAAGDLVVTVFPFEADNATVAPIAVPVVQSVGPTLDTGKVYFYGQYDVQGIDRVRIRVRNNNAGAQTINRWSWKLT